MKLLTASAKQMHNAGVSITQQPPSQTFEDIRGTQITSPLLLSGCSSKQFKSTKHFAGKTNTKECFFFPDHPLF